MATLQDPKQTAAELEEKLLGLFQILDIFLPETHVSCSMDQRSPEPKHKFLKNFFFVKQF